VTPVARANAPPAVWLPFALEFVDGDGRARREPLAACAAVSFECGPAVRSFPSYRGQRNWPGLWWSATMAGHVGYESWLERDHAMLLDFDAEVTAFAAQPFWLLFRGDDGAARRHAPDFFARRPDGTGLVVDCRPDERIRPPDAEAFAATERACALVGWEYRRVGAVEPVLAENVRWLAGYRHPRHHRDETVPVLLRVFAEPRPLMAGAETAGPPPLVVLPVLFHLLWTGWLRTGLSTPLAETSVVWSAPP
jgi:hypothetical protein